MQVTFINYRRDDAAAEAKLVANALRSVAGHEAVFMDTSSIGLGDTWPRQIQAALEASQYVMVVIGPDWLRAGINEWGQRRIDGESDWVRQEIAEALANCEQLIIPVLVRGGRMPPKNALPPVIADLSTKQAIELRRDYWDHDIQLLKGRLYPKQAEQSGVSDTVHTNHTTPFDSIWDRLDTSLQDAFALAANDARRQGKDIISTRTLFAAFRRLHPGHLPDFFSHLPSDALPDPIPDSTPIRSDALADIRLLSACVQDSLNHLAPQATENNKLTSEDVFVDIARYGRGNSVQRLRTHGIDAIRIDEIVGQLGWSVLDRHLERA